MNLIDHLSAQIGMTYSPNQRLEEALVNPWVTMTMRNPTEGDIARMVRAMLDLHTDTRCISTPTISFKLRGLTAGMAHKTGNKIRLNAELLNEHPDQWISTLRHELAHIVVFHLYDGIRVRPHGPEWQRWAKHFGDDAGRCHNMAAKRARTSWEYEYSDILGNVVWMGAGRHRNSQRGRKYSLKQAGSPLVWTGKKRRRV